MVYPITRYTIIKPLKKYIQTLTGEENLTAPPPFIVAANHISQADAVFIMVALFPHYKKKIHFIAFPGDWPKWFRKIITEQWAGCIVMDKQRPADCLNIANKKLQKGKIVGIFPEGERSPNSDSLKRGKTGAVRLALHNQVPIVPIGLFIAEGEEHRDIRGEKRSYIRDGIKHFIFRKNKIPVRLTIGKPISFEQYYNMPITYELLRKLTDELMNTISELSGKKYPHQ